MPDIPNNPVPSLRAFLGQIALTKTTPTTTNRGLHKLQGGLASNDIDVRDVVNATIDALDALDVGTQVSVDQRASSGFVATLAQNGTGGTETIATYAYSGPAVVDSYDVDVAMLTDDGQDGFVGRYVLGVVWNGSALTALGASTSVFEQSSAGAASAAFEIDISGTSVRMRFTGVTDWRWAVAVRRTRRKFA